MISCPMVYPSVAFSFIYGNHVEKVTDHKSFFYFIRIKINEKVMFLNTFAQRADLLEPGLDIAVLWSAVKFLNYY